MAQALPGAGVARHRPLFIGRSGTWTAKIFGHACGETKDGKGGYRKVNGKVGMHRHVDGGDDGVHVKIGQKPILIISVTGKFLPGGWQEAVDAVVERATGDLRLNLLAAMAIILAERTGGLSPEEVARIIAALQIPPADK